MDNVLLLDCFYSKDNRGSFTKVFHMEQLENMKVSNIQWKETYYSFSNKNVLRGMHFQVPPMDHEKMVHVMSGSVLDVVLDLRKKSTNYGKVQVFYLSAKKPQALFIPKGFAHGFLTLEDNTNMLYHVSTSYSKEHDKGIDYRSISFDWGIENPILSERDQTFPNFEDFISPF